jgi:thiol-disulfide isomerase/thioredoxin
MRWKPVFDGGLRYERFLQVHGPGTHAARWQAVYERAALADEPRRLVAGFTRQMNVLCLAGAWCGDCVNQCPLLQRIAEANPLIDLRFLDRDVNPAVRDELAVNGGQRVPVVVFLSEDFYECGRYGDRTLATYRQMASAQLGPACPTGVAPAERNTLEQVTREWLDEFERVQLMLRLSARLRSLHGD